MNDEKKAYNCKYHKWDYYWQYGCKIIDGELCKLKDRDCKSPCEDFTPKGEVE